MMEENRYQATPKKRNNNLAGYAIVCFIIGGPMLQISLVFLPFLWMFPGASTVGIIALLAIGVVFVIGGVYFLVQWFNSGD
jgi:hypothetical protein